MIMATNINVELFKRYAPKKKLEIIEKLSNDELMNVSTATIERIVKEAGTKMYKSRDKRLYISRDRHSGCQPPLLPPPAQSETGILAPLG